LAAIIPYRADLAVFFREVPIEKDNPYGRGNIKMELNL